MKNRNHHKLKMSTYGSVFVWKRMHVGFIMAFFLVKYLVVFLLDRYYFEIIELINKYQVLEYLKLDLFFVLFILISPYVSYILIMYLFYKFLNRRFKRRFTSRYKDCPEEFICRKHGGEQKTYYVTPYNDGMPAEPVLFLPWLNPVTHPTLRYIKYIYGVGRRFIHIRRCPKCDAFIGKCPYCGTMMDEEHICGERCPHCGKQFYSWM